jgi:hypothetical protein
MLATAWIAPLWANDTSATLSPIALKEVTEVETEIDWIEADMLEEDALVSVM